MTIDQKILDRLSSELRRKLFRRLGVIYAPTSEDFTRVARKGLRYVGVPGFEDLLVPKGKVEELKVGLVMIKDIMVNLRKIDLEV